MTKKKIPEFLFYMKGCVQLRREMLFLSFAVKKKRFWKYQLKIASSEHGEGNVQ
jgi:hypothetical protein